MRPSTSLGTGRIALALALFSTSAFARPSPDAPPPKAEKKAAEAAKDPAHAVAAKIQKFYESTADLHARFDQELDSPVGGRKKASGQVWLKKPGRMRWEYERPEKKSMIADGASLWVYEPEDEQAFKQSLKTSTLPSSVTFLFGTGKLGDEFTITLERGAGEPQKDDRPESKLGAPDDAVIKLVPIKPTAQYRYLVFIVDGRTSMVKETWVWDQQGGANHMTFRDVKTNQGVPDGKFSFTPPPGTKILHP